ncbi:MAG: hypothetical protein WBR35_17475, partial [Anaerolineae bacterium]
MTTPRLPFLFRWVTVELGYQIVIDSNLPLAYVFFTLLMGILQLHTTFFSAMQPEMQFLTARLTANRSLALRETHPKGCTTNFAGLLHFCMPIDLAERQIGETTRFHFPCFHDRQTKLVSEALHCRPDVVAKIIAAIGLPHTR